MILVDSPIFNKFSTEIIQKTIPLIKEYKSSPSEKILIDG